ncbi:L-serine dehydratase/L-threonine deaminase-like protein [Zopfochytrium polystomum]|nr:L-serine dehydratase/L-threonine deaminase-like protein [Zopfochytrium polystomum]
MVGLTVSPDSSFLDASAGAPASGATAAAAAPKQLHVCTPLVPAPDAVAKALGVSKVLYKLDNLQPSGSFKIRGIGRMLTNALAAATTRSSTVGPRPTPEAVSSSGGNAGLATAHVAQSLGIPCRVFTPSSTPASTVARLRSFGATVVVSGAIWDEANAEALAYCEAQRLAGFPTVMVHPFDHPDLWAGHASLSTEIFDQAQTLLGPNERVDAIVCAVGGGGMLTGILEGLRDMPHQPAVVAVETNGAASFSAAIKAGQPTNIPSITSIAKSLGMSKVADAVMAARAAYGAGKVVDITVNDREAVKAVISFLDQERYLVEPACGAALAAVYEPGLIAERLRELGGEVELTRDASVVVVVVCGGSNVTFDAITKWKNEFDL